jgi:two-component system, LytTR family, response regulator
MRYVAESVLFPGNRICTGFEFVRWKYPYVGCKRPTGACAQSNTAYAHPNSPFVVIATRASVRLNGHVDVRRSMLGAKKMGSMPAPHLIQHPQTTRGGMRVVVLEPSADFRDGLQSVLEQTPGFLFVGDSRNWDDCLTLLETHLPELLITRSTCVPPRSQDLSRNAEFPVVMALRPKHGETLAGAFETIDLPIDPSCFLVAMERVRTEIYRRKLKEISLLFGRYIDYSRGVHRFLNVVRVEDGRDTEIPAENVMFVAADGNYVRLHTGKDVHEIRETMAGMTAKLDPAQFARIHRSFIVNRANVASVLRKEGAVTCVLLNNGTELPVGPNYRTELDGFESCSRLSA